MRPFSLDRANQCRFGSPAWKVEPNWKAKRGTVHSSFTNTSVSETTIEEIKDKPSVFTALRTECLQVFAEGIQGF
jgi:hypothetical protein